MNRKKLLYLVIWQSLIIGSLFPGITKAQPDSTETAGLEAREIVRRADEKIRGQTSYIEMTMTIVRPDWSRETSLKSWSKGTEQALIVISAPARDKGNAFLKIKNDLWNWIPAIERTVKIPPSMMMQSWMGSDFTNDDLVKESSIVHDYTHTIIGRETIAERDCHKIELLPLPDAPVVWGKIFLWITSEDDLEMKAEYYDEDEFLMQTMNLSDIKELGGRVIPTILEMIPADEEKEGHKTVLLYSYAEFDKEIEDSFFSKQNMKRVR